MATVRGIRERIASVRHTAQLTKGMEMVATSKVKNFQEQVLAVRPYSLRAWNVLSNLASAEGEDRFTHPLFRSREVRAVGLLVIGADRGLNGSFQRDLIRVVEDYIRLQSAPVRVVTVGRQTQAWAARTGQEVIAEFPVLPSQPTLDDVGPIARTVIREYTEGRVDLVHFASTRFLSTSRQRPATWQLLPIVVIERARIQAVRYICEPDLRTILEEIVPRFIQLQVHDAVLESAASEHSARRMAMHKAHLNANDLLADLSLQYNKTRQRTITDDILEIVGGAGASALGGSRR